MECLGDYEYTTNNILGHGAFAMVFKGRSKRDKIDVAIKKIKKNAMSKLSNKEKKEVSILKGLKHDNIVRLYDFFETSNDIFLILEYCNSGDFSDFLSKNKNLIEEHIRYIFKQISCAILFLHTQKIIHRDLKPQNILLNNSMMKSLNNAANATITISSIYYLTAKLADFGFARVLAESALATTICGSPLYMAPEVLLSHSYDAKADLWSIGTIIYQSLVGRAPFVAETPEKLKKKYEESKELIPRIPNSTSESLKHLISSLLQRTPTSRLTFEAFSAHPFFQGLKIIPQDPISQKLPITNFRHQIESNPYSCVNSSESATLISYKANSPSSHYMFANSSPNTLPIDLISKSSDPPSNFALSPSSTQNLLFNKVSFENHDDDNICSLNDFVFVSKDFQSSLKFINSRSLLAKQITDTTTSSSPTDTRASNSLPTTINRYKRDIPFSGLIRNLETIDNSNNICCNSTNVIYNNISCSSSNNIDTKVITSNQTSSYTHKSNCKLYSNVRKKDELLFDLETDSDDLEIITTATTTMITTNTTTTTTNTTNNKNHKIKNNNIELFNHNLIPSHLIKNKSYLNSNADVDTMGCPKDLTNEIFERHSFRKLSNVSFKPMFGTINECKFKSFNKDQLNKASDILHHRSSYPLDLELQHMNESTRNVKKLVSCQRESFGNKVQSFEPATQSISISIQSSFNEEDSKSIRMGGQVIVEDESFSLSKFNLTELNPMMYKKQKYEFQNSLEEESYYILTFANCTFEIIDLFRSPFLSLHQNLHLTKAVLHYNSDTRIKLQSIVLLVKASKVLLQFLDKAKNSQCKLSNFKSIIQIVKECESRIISTMDSFKPHINLEKYVSTILSAEDVIYERMADLCKNASLDQVFNNITQDCFNKYRKAFSLCYVLLLSVQNIDHKLVLMQYSEHIKSMLSL